MALTTNKKNKIIADWKTGKFKSYTQIAKHYKIDPKTAKKILNGIQQSNADIVEAAVVVDNAKKSIKNPVEFKAVENAIEERIQNVEFFKSSALKNQGIANKAVDAISDMIDEAEDKKKGAVAINGLSIMKDNAQITAKNKETVLGKDADTQVNIQNNQTQTVEIDEDLVKKVLLDFDDEY